LWRRKIYWSDGDEAFIAEAPELPGCMADGPSPAEALANLQVVMAEWIETARDLGRSVPEPQRRPLVA
jgi:predicted RNase H-like HicB family nuclease